MFGIYHVSWRFVVIITNVKQMLATVMVYLFVPESARYLAMQGRHKDAAKAANTIATALNTSAPKLEEEEVRVRYFFVIKNVTDRSFKKVSLEAWTNIKKLYSPSLRRQTLVLNFVWFTVSTAHGLCTWINTLFVTLGMDHIYLHCLFFALANVPGNIFAAILSDNVTRKTLLISSMVLTSVCLNFFAYASSQPNPSNFYVTLSACAYHTFLILTLCTLSVMTAEIFPTSVRNSGMGICIAYGRISEMITQYLGAFLSENPSLLLYIVSLIMVVGSLGPFIISQDDMSGSSLKDDIEPRSSTRST